MKQAAVELNGVAPASRTVTRFAAAERFRIREALAAAVRSAGEELIALKTPTWEARSILKNHAATRSDLEANGVLFNKSMASLAPLDVVPSFESEELPLVPVRCDGQRYIRLIVDPIDGTKAFDNARTISDCPVPRPSSAISVAAVCPVTKRLLASAVYVFDLSEVFSSVCLEQPHNGPCYLAFRDDCLLPPLCEVFSPAALQLQTKKRLLNGNYNSRALPELAAFEMALADAGLKPNYGGLSGSSATDIINVVRGSYAACVDVRALCRGGGSVPYWYDVAGVIPIARARGLRVILVRPDGRECVCENMPAYERISFVVARQDVVGTVVAALARSVAPHLLLADPAPVPAAAALCGIA